MQKDPTSLSPVHHDITYSALRDRNLWVPLEPHESLVSPSLVSLDLARI